MCLSAQLEAISWGSLNVSSLKLAFNAMNEARRFIVASIPEAPEGYGFLFNIGSTVVEMELEQINVQFQARGVDLRDREFSYSQEDLEAVIALLNHVINEFGVQNEDIHAQLRASIFALIMASLQGQHLHVEHHAALLQLRDDYANLADAYLRRAQILHAWQQRRALVREHQEHHDATLVDLVNAAHEALAGEPLGNNQRFLGPGNVDILGPGCG
ncbi:MAG TPA: hypothetical protein DIU37_05560 [Opitutae bacterium]|nr:hypothetical protein [Opitutae bacterium]